MFYIRHVLPVVVLSIILGFLVSTFYVDKSVFFPETSLVKPETGQQFFQNKPQLNHPVKPVMLKTDSLDEADSSVEGLNESENEDWSVDEFVKAIENKPLTSKRIRTVNGIKMAHDDSLLENDVPVDVYLSSISKEAQKTISVTPIEGEKDKIMVHDTRTGKYKIITVKEGDSLSEIADRVYGDYRKLDIIMKANKNKLSSPDDLTVGQKIKVPLQ